MARRKSRWQKMLNLKPAAFAGFSLLHKAVPQVGRFLSFHPEIGPVPDRITRLVLDRRRPIRLSEPAFKAQLDELAVHDWDVKRDLIIDRDPLSNHAFIALMSAVSVPGHTMTPVDVASGRQIGVGRLGVGNWFSARPQFVPGARRHVQGPVFVLNPYRNMWHIMIEMLVPLAAAARLAAWGDRELVIATRRNRPSLVDAFVEGLQRTSGVRMRVMELGPTEVLTADEALIADNVCWNVERAFGFPEAIAGISRAFASSYGERMSAQRPSERLYITRKGVKLRQIINEDEVIELVTSMGFSVLHARWDNHPEQLAAFGGASTIVGVHGAGLTNLLFARPDARILEIFPHDHRKTSMLHLCAETGRAHAAFFGSPEGVNQAFTVDIGRLRDRLGALLA